MAAPTLNPYITAVVTVSAATTAALDTAIATAIAAGLEKDTAEYATGIVRNTINTTAGVEYSATITFTTAAS